MHKKSNTRKCTICGKILVKSQTIYCSNACGGKFRSKTYKGKYTGAKAGSWKGGQVLILGRVYLYAPTHPNANFNGMYVSRARAVMAEKLGRPIAANENVHHINGIITDDRIENLILLTHSEHKKLHWAGKTAAQRKYERENHVDLIPHNNPL